MTNRPARYNHNYRSDMPLRRQDRRRTGASAIITITESGLSARLVAKYRPRSTLLAITDRLTTQRALAVTWGVHALLLEQVGDSLITLAEAEQLALSLGLVSPGDLLVFTGGLPQHLPGRTNLLKVQVAREG